MMEEGRDGEQGEGREGFAPTEQRTVSRKEIEAACGEMTVIQVKGGNPVLR